MCVCVCSCVRASPFCWMCWWGLRAVWSCCLLLLKFCNGADSGVGWGSVVGPG